MGVATPGQERDEPSRPLRILAVRFPYPEALRQAVARVAPEAHLTQIDLHGFNRRRRRAFLAKPGLRLPPADPPELERHLREMSDYMLRRYEGRLAKLSPRLYRFLVRRKFYLALGVVSDMVREADLVLNWNGLTVPGALASYAAKVMGKRVIYLERGTFPNTVQIDPEGVNAGSSVARLDPATLDEIELTPERRARIESLAFGNRPPGRINLGAPAPLASFDAVELPERFVLYGSQVHDDTQIRFYSPRFPTVADAIRFVYRELEAYNAGGGAALRLVVKEHPQDEGRIDYGNLKEELKGAIFIARADNGALIPRARAFVTINSSMGLQAIHCGVPVVTLGDALYNLPGVAWHLGAGEGLADGLDDVLQGRFVHRARQLRLFTYLLENVLMDLQLYDPPAHQIEALAARLVLGRG